MIGYVILAIVIVLVLYVVSAYNSLVSLRNKVRDQFSQIDVQLKRRSDLIPNLVETVKGYAKHEQETLEQVISARNSYVTANTADEKMKADKEMSSCISRLFALSESYPELKANVNFQELQKELKETEDKISYSRQFYNDSVLKYNNKLEVIPSNIVASLFHFEKAAFFEATEAEREVVKVKF